MLDLKKALCRFALFSAFVCATASSALAAPPTFSGNIITVTGPAANILYYGAKGDGTTDDTTAIRNAIAAAIAVHGSVYIPPTNSCYRITGSLPINTAFNFMVYGSGYNSQICPDSGVSAFVVNGTAAILQNFRMVWPFPNRDTTSVAIQLNSGADAWVRDVVVYNAYEGFEPNASQWYVDHVRFVVNPFGIAFNLKTPGGTIIQNSTGSVNRWASNFTSSVTAGDTVLHVVNGSLFRVGDVLSLGTSDNDLVTITVISTNTLTVSPGAANSYTTSDHAEIGPQPGSNCIQAQRTGHQDTLYLLNDICFGFNHGFDAEPPTGASGGSFWAQNLIFDGNAASAFYVKPTGSGSFGGFECFNCWFHSANGDGIELHGPSNDYDFVGGSVAGGVSGHGINIADSGVFQVAFTGRFEVIGQSYANGKCGVNLAANAGIIDFIGLFEEGFSYGVCAGGGISQVRFVGGSVSSNLVSNLNFTDSWATLTGNHVSMQDVYGTPTTRMGDQTITGGLIATLGERPNGSAGGYAPELFPLGVVAVHPQMITGSCASIAVAGTVCTFPNSFTFGGTTYQCQFSAEGAVGHFFSYDTKTTTTMKVYSDAGTPTVDYVCAR